MLSLQFTIHIAKPPPLFSTPRVLLLSLYSTPSVLIIIFLVKIVEEAHTPPYSLNPNYETTLSMNLAVRLGSHMNNTQQYTI